MHHSGVCVPSPSIDRSLYRRFRSVELTHLPDPTTAARRRFRDVCPPDGLPGEVVNLRS